MGKDFKNPNAKPVTLTSMVEGRRSLSDARMAESESASSDVLDKLELAASDIPNIYYNTSNSECNIKQSHYIVNVFERYPEFVMWALCLQHVQYPSIPDMCIV